jgi:DNA adenine methylase
MHPFLKWVGGKRQLLHELRPRYPQEFRRYIEPFVGSGAVFFDLYGSGTLDGRNAWLVDDNPDLIGCYQMVRNQTEAVIAELEMLAAGHRAGGEAHYYQVRDERFNPSRSAGGVYTPELAAMLIYLNRTGFNGLFRLNRRGEFNVPAGRYANPRICDAEHLRAVATVLRDPHVVVERGSFERPLAAAGTGDFIYCDPPYAPLSRTASFANYTARGFSADDQTRLQQAVIAAARRGACVILSNSSAPEIRRLYAGAEARDAGLIVLPVMARRAINSSPGQRGPIAELLATNMRANRGKLAVRMLPAVPRARTPERRRA